MDAWAYGETSGYRPLIEGRSLQCLDAAGIAVDSAA
jgi:hypothetical protein